MVGIIWWSQVLTSYETFNKADLLISKADLGENKLLTDSGNDILVSSLIKSKPFTLFVFYRGHWWPYCIAELVKLENKRQDLEELNVQVVPICIGTLEDIV